MQWPQVQNSFTADWPYLPRALYQRINCPTPVYTAHCTLHAGHCTLNTVPLWCDVTCYILCCQLCFNGAYDTRQTLSLPRSTSLLRRELDFWNACFFWEFGAFVSVFCEKVGAFLWLSDQENLTRSPVMPPFVLITRKECPLFWPNLCPFAIILQSTETTEGFIVWCAQLCLDLSQLMGL